MILKLLHSERFKKEKPLMTASRFFDPIPDNVACRNCDHGSASEADRVLIYASEVADSLDWRFTPDICARLDRIYRDDWMQTVKKQSRASELCRLRFF